MSQAQESNKPNTKILTRVLAAFLLSGGWIAFLAPMVKFQFWQPDTFWLIETGRYILEKHCLPERDIFSFTSTAPHWVVYQWLSEIIFSLANAACGLMGVAIVGMLLLAFLFCFLIFRSMLKEQTGPLSAFVAVWLCAYAFFPYLSSLRPQLISFVLFWLLIRVCQAAKKNDGQKQILICIFIIAVVWANCHISFPIGALLLGSHLIGCSFMKTSKRLLAAGMLVVFLSGTLITPHGFALWPFLSSLRNIVPTPELQPLPWATQPQLAALALLCMAAFWYRRKELGASEIVAGLLLLIAGSSCSRLIIYFWIFCCPVAGAALSQLIAARVRQPKLVALSEATRSIALSKFYAIAILLISVGTTITQPIFLRSNIPVQAAAFLKEQSPKGNLFCDAQSGSYLIYAAQGTIPVFLDTRLDLYNPDFVFRFSKALNEGDDWQGLFDRYKIDLALVPNNRPLAAIIGSSTNWKTIYQDQDFSLFTRK